MIFYFLVQLQWESGFNIEAYDILAIQFLGMDHS